MEICGEAADAETALAEIARVRPDIAVVDLSLRGASGIELLKHVRELDAGIGVVVLSMRPESAYGLRSLSAGARGYIPKQDAPEKIVEAIRRIHAGGLFASRELSASLLQRIQTRNTRDAANPVADLTDRELEIAELVGEGSTTNEIAVKLHVSRKTVQAHRTEMKRKLRLDTSAQLVNFCVRWFQEHGSGAANRTACLAGR